MKRLTLLIVPSSEEKVPDKQNNDKWYAEKPKDQCTEHIVSPSCRNFNDLAGNWFPEGLCVRLRRLDSFQRIRKNFNDPSIIQ